MMNFVSVLTITGETIHEDNDLVIVTETRALALNIAIDKLLRSETDIARKYGKYCTKYAKSFPTLRVISFREWLEKSIDCEELEGVTITPKAVVTAEDLDKIAF